MNLSTIRKSISAGVLAGAGTYTSLAATGGASTEAYVIAGGVVGVVTALITWWLPNDADPNAVTIKELIAKLEASVLHIPASARVDAALPTGTTVGTKANIITADPPASASV